MTKQGKPFPIKRRAHFDPAALLETAAKRRIILTHPVGRVIFAQRASGDLHQGGYGKIRHRHSEYSIRQAAAKSNVEIRTPPTTA